MITTYPKALMSEKTKQLIKGEVSDQLAEQFAKQPKPILLSAELSERLLSNPIELSIFDRWMKQLKQSQCWPLTFTLTYEVN